MIVVQVEKESSQCSARSCSQVRSEINIVWSSRVHAFSPNSLHTTFMKDFLLLAFVKLEIK